MKKNKINKMPGQTYFAPFVLLALHNLGGRAQTKHAIKTTLSFFDVSDKIMDKKSKTGREPIIHNRIRWARNDLSAAGYIDGSDYGYWQLTEQAKELIPDLIKTHKQGSDFSSLSELFSRKDSSSKGRESSSDSSDGDDALSVFGHVETETIPSDSDESGLSPEMQDLEIIQGMNAFAFERLCAKLFSAVGYENVENTKKSGDGGFDGLGYLSIGLVRFKVAFEAKRWKDSNKVGPKEIREFSGTMNRMRAEKGVFITTSSFTAEARKDGGDLKIDLIDGEKLVELLYKHDIGCVKRLDKGYFDEI